MSASLPTSRLARFAILTATGMTALSLAACGSSNTSSPTTAPSSTSTAVASPPTSSSAPGNGQTRVSGLIASVSGNAVQVTQQNGNATVDFSGTTKVTESSRAALTDVTSGSCVSVRPQQGSQSGQPVTAASVRISTAVNGKCPPANGSGKPGVVQGSVASVAGSTINVTSTDGTQTAVTVSDTTKYSKQAAADTQAISAGKCLTAKGTQDGGGALQATTIDLRPAHDGKCAGEAGHHGHGG